MNEVVIAIATAVPELLINLKDTTQEIIVSIENTELELVAEITATGPKGDDQDSLTNIEIEALLSSFV